jgi:hypothetical protein
VPVAAKLWPRGRDAAPSNRARASARASARRARRPRRASAARAAARRRSSSGELGRCASGAPRPASSPRGSAKRRDAPASCADPRVGPRPPVPTRGRLERQRGPQRGSGGRPGLEGAPTAEATTSPPPRRKTRWSAVTHQNRAPKIQKKPLRARARRDEIKAPPPKTADAAAHLQRARGLPAARKRAVVVGWREARSILKRL